MFERDDHVRWKDEVRPFTRPNVTPFDNVV